MKPLALIGYSGHAYVVYEIFESAGRQAAAYTEVAEKKINPYGLEYLGSERHENVISKLKGFDHFVSIGDNSSRRKVSEHLLALLGEPVNAIDASALISKTVQFGYGNMFARGVKVNAISKIGNGVICNTGSIIEHECNLGDFSHIAPGAVLCGNVTVGENTFIGANAVVRPGISIGKNVIVGAGTVVVKDIADNLTVMGNPHRNK
jgi:sugar O-acyltransferase (sialic acid O-acetyltransferase NeuD family)